MTDLVPVPSGALQTDVREYDPLKVYLKGLEGRPKTHSTMREGLVRIAKVSRIPLEAMPWATLDYARTTAIRAELLKTYKSPRTVRVTLAALRGILKTCWQLGHMTNEAMARAITWQKLNFSTLPAGRVLADAELDAVAGYLRSVKGAYGVFLRAVLGVLFSSGARATELSSCSVEDMRGDALHVLRKGSKEALLPLGENEQAWLATWTAQRERLRPTSCFLFVQVSPRSKLAEPEPLTVQRLNRLCATVAAGAGIPKFHPHDCRRTFCTQLLDAGVDLGMVQYLMGHASPETTMIYDRRGWEAAAKIKRGVKVGLERVAT